MINIFRSFASIHIEGNKSQALKADVFSVDENKVPFVYIPITSPNGTEMDIFVKEGDQVLVGTLIGRRKDFYVPVFSSVSGIVKGRASIYNPLAGRATEHLEIANDFKRQEPSL